MLASSFSCYMFMRYCLFFPLCVQAIIPPSNGAIENPKNTSPHQEITTHAWHEFEKLRDASKGIHVRGISQLKKYFKRFGYLKHGEDFYSDVFDSNLEHAVRAYQRKRALPITGKLDSSTLSQIMSPRCGVSDTQTTEAKLSLHKSHNYVYFTGRPRWARDLPMTLTYSLSPKDLITSPSTLDMKAVFKRAFSTWASVIPVTFIETEDYPFADIKIGFYYGDHGDGEAFDGVLGVLAHAFSPESGRLHLDAAETWAVDFGKEKSGVAVDLESVAVHEIGHLLGLAHSDVRETVMYPSLRPREKKVELKIDDIRGVQALYGSNPNFSFYGFSESDVSSNNSGCLDWRVGEDQMVVRVSFMMAMVFFVLCM